MGRISAVVTSLAVALAFAASASAYNPYGWPIRPFHVQHPVRGFFGDPRTVYYDAIDGDGLNGPGKFSFHNGIDIAAPDGTYVYPVVGGIVHLIDATAVSVDTLDGRHFQYFHIVPFVFQGQRVLGGITRLGRIQAPFGHVHLSEIDGSYIRNPLLKGHLTPYADHTKPQIASFVVSSASDGKQLDPTAVCGKISVIVSASDEPPLPVPGSFAGLPVTAALVTWRLASVDGKVVVPTTAAADFRRTLPPQRDFWNVYARGTYENAPRFGFLQYPGTPGRYLFLLAAAFDTRTLRNGSYLLDVRAADERGNAAVRRLPFTVENTGVCAGEGVPPAPVPALKDGGRPGGGGEEPPPTTP